MVPDNSTSPNPVPSFLYGTESWDFASVSGPWPIDLKVSLVVRIG